MKKLFYLLIIAIVLTIASCTTIEKAPLEGAWQCVSSTYISPEDSSSYSIETNSSRRDILLFTKNYFGFIDQDTTGAVFGGGTYTWDGSTFTEKYDSFKNPKFIGHSVTYSTKMINNKLQISGTMKLKEWGVADYNYEIEELWRKIE